MVSIENCYVFEELIKTKDKDHDIVKIILNNYKKTIEFFMMEGDAICFASSIKNKIRRR